MLFTNDTWVPQLGTSFTVFLHQGFKPNCTGCTSWICRRAEPSTEVVNGCEQLLCTPLCLRSVYINYV